MIQISFEAAFDPFHTAFRILRQLAYVPGSSIFIPRLKMIDLFVLEPQRCSELGLAKRERSKAATMVKFQPQLYGKRPSSQALLNQMSPIQDAAIQTLVLQGFLDATSFESDEAARTAKVIPDALSTSLKDANTAQGELMDFLLLELGKHPYHGNRGLKAITGLAEYRYDVV